MNIFKNLFGRKEPANNPDNVPYYWGTDALKEINRMLAEQVEETERFLSKKFPA